MSYLRLQPQPYKANPATPSARPVNSCAVSRCQRLGFRRFEIVDMLRITSFKARASGRTANAGRERPLTAARVGAGCARRRGISAGPGSPNAHQRRYRAAGGLSTVTGQSGVAMQPGSIRLVTALIPPPHMNEQRLNWVKALIIPIPACMR